MSYVIRFSVSYVAALLAVFVFVTVIVISFFEIDLFSYSRGILSSSVSVAALLALLPAIIAVWLEAKHSKYLKVSKFGLYGMITGFIESTIFIWIAYNGDLASGSRYILSLTLAGSIGGTSLALIWNRLTTPSP